MKYLVLIACFAYVFISCQGKAPVADQKVAAPAVPVVNADSSEIADVLHRFFTWYGNTGEQLITKIDFVDEKGKHPKLDEAMLAKYLAEFVKSGTVSAEFVENESAHYRECAKSWKDELSGEVISCLDYDRYYCQQDGDVQEFLSAGVSSKITGDRASVQLMLDPNGPNGGPRDFEMKKENGKWLLSKIGCQ